MFMCAAADGSTSNDSKLCAEGRKHLLHCSHELLLGNVLVQVSFGGDNGSTEDDCCFIMVTSCLGFSDFFFFVMLFFAS